MEPTQELQSTQNAGFNYNRGRQLFAEFRNSELRQRKMKQGMVHWYHMVLSPTRFNLYVSKMPLLPPGITVVSYADDCTLIASSPNIERLWEVLNGYLNTHNSWCDSKLSMPKSTATLFTSFKVPMDLNTKILGIVFDQLNWTTVPGTCLTAQDRPLTTYGRLSQSRIRVTNISIDKSL